MSEFLLLWFPACYANSFRLMALKCCRSETLAPFPPISSLSFNLSAADTINLGASQPVRVPRRSCKAYNFKADKRDCLRRSSKDYFHHKGRQEFRKRCRFKLQELRQKLPSGTLGLFGEKWRHVRLWFLHFTGLSRKHFNTLCRKVEGFLRTQKLTGLRDFFRNT